MRCLLVYQDTGRHFWKVDGTLSGLELEALDYLLPGLYLSEYHIDESLFLNFIFHPFLIPMRNVIIFIVATILLGNPNCCRRFPSNLANLSKMDVVIKDGNAKVTAHMKLLYSVSFHL